MSDMKPLVDRFNEMTVADDDDEDEKPEKGAEDIGEKLVMKVITVYSTLVKALTSLVWVNDMTPKIVVQKNNGNVRLKRKTAKEISKEVCCIL